ncbi:MAG: hypothetical protein HFH30_07415 [Eubacterium sp.]|nr:hypothetical protein [Eubacterium sp.]MCI8918800.1 hypothetical protein [Eubacterium sp.]
MKKIKEFWVSLEEETIISKKELFLGLMTCLLAGIVAGVFFGPKKNVAIGSNNGNGSCKDCKLLEEGCEEA